MLAKSLIRGVVSLFHPRIFTLMLWPVAVALALWIVLALAFWGPAVAAANGMLRDTPVVEWMFAVAPLAAVATHLGWILLALLFVPLVLVTSTLIIGAFAMPVMVNHVAERDYPHLGRRRGGGTTGSVWNTLVATIWFAGAVALSLPLWLVPPLWPALPALLLGYLNYRMFPYDALAEHASAQELSEIMRRDRAPLFTLGVLVALAGHVPLLGFFAPLYGGLAYIHYGLARLEAYRAAPIEGMARRVDG